MSKTQIDFELRNDLLRFLKRVADEGFNMQTTNDANGLYHLLKPQRNRLRKSDYQQLNGV